MSHYTLEELLENEELRQREFPVCRKSIFLAHAGVCPLPRTVVAAMADYQQRCLEGDQETVLPVERLHQVRGLASRLIGATPEEVALVGPTSLALSFVASGVEFRRHDNVLIYFDDYPSNVYPWMALAEHGIEVRLLNIRQLGRIRPVDVLGQVDEQTRLVALASCHFISGHRLEVEALGRELRKRKILFCLDAIQTLGAIPTPAAEVDFLAADAHKWLLGPCGAGIFYVRKSLQEDLKPPVYGWHNVRCPNFVAQEQLIFPPDARRYEAGTANLVGLVGLQAALELLLALGVDTIAAELKRKRNWLVPALQDLDFTVLNPDSGQAAAITSFYREGMDMAALHRKLSDQQIVTSLRTDRTGRQYIRVSPHFYNTDAELARLLEALRAP